MRTMDMPLVKLYQEGKITKELAYEKAHNREEITRMLEGN